MYLQLGTTSPEFTIKIFSPGKRLFTISHYGVNPLHYFTVLPGIFTGSISMTHSRRRSIPRLFVVVSLL